MYHHTQIGWVIVSTFAAIIIFLGYWVLFNPLIYPAVTVLVLIALVILFGGLTVKGDEKELSFYFGPGIMKRRFKYSEIDSATKVRNRWFYGWGLRWYGRGWLYNVSGLDAIELHLKGGRQLRIGTDEPDRLIEFITRKISK